MLSTLGTARDEVVNQAQAAIGEKQSALRLYAARPNKCGNTGISKC